MIVGIIGAGAWGSALAHIVARGDNKVVLWSFDGVYSKFDSTGTPRNITVTRNMADLQKCDAWIAVTPAAFFRETMVRAATFYNNQPVIICTKGAEPETGKFMTEVMPKRIRRSNIGVLSGPQFAAEVANGVPTGSTLAGGRKVQDAGATIFNKMYIEKTSDVIGAELCGVGKNAVSLIAGYARVMGGGENESALTMTRAWGEVIKIAVRMGAKERTFLGLCGIGDLLLTATSGTSRNFSAGVAIARGEIPTGTIEGISALDALVKRAKSLHKTVPVLSEMHNIISRQKM